MILVTQLCFYWSLAFLLPIFLLLFLSRNYENLLRWLDNLFLPFSIIGSLLLQISFTSLLLRLVIGNQLLSGSIFLVIVLLASIWPTKLRLKVKNYFKSKFEKEDEDNKEYFFETKALDN